VSAAPITLPAHVSLLTGLYPFRHGVRNNGNFVLGASTPTLATQLHDRGYATGAFVSAFVLDRRYGLSRGFDEYDDRVELERRADATSAAAGDWLSRNATTSRPFFAWVHFYDPHDPYDPPEPFRRAFAERPYDGEIAFADSGVGTLIARLRQLGSLDDTVVAVVGDHGESLGEHGEATHGMFVYESAVRVPMLLRWPRRVTGGRRISALVRTVDLAPTILSLTGQASSSAIDGRDLTPLIDGAAPGPGEAYSETYFPQLFMNWSALRSIQDERWKLIEGPEPELYDLASDPGELDDLRARQPARATALQRAIEGVAGGGEGPLRPGRVDRETARKLAALGYVGAADDRPASSSSHRADPKAMIGVFNTLREANAAIQAKRYAQAEAAASDVLRRDRDNAFAVMIRARAQMEQGRYRKAGAGFRTYAGLIPSSADAHHWMAICHSRLGEVDRALAEEEAALAIDPRYAEAHALRGGLFAARGRLDEGVREMRAAVDAAPENVAFRIGLARVLLASGQLDAAGAELGRALERQPDNPDAHAGRGGLLAARGDLDAAREEFERALAIQPDADDVRLDFADVLQRMGRRGEAREQLVRLADGRDTPPDIRARARALLR
jgi:choline-sulfatase